MKYPHWQYFLTLDADLDNTSRYVEICKDNYDTYSIEYVHILLAACSEIDVVAKLLCKKIDPSASPGNINDYRNIITRKYSHFHVMEIVLPRYAITLIPWEAWGRNANPTWWTNYNNVKHHRDSFFREANLENVVNAVAGLYVMVIYLYYEALHKLTPPKLISLSEKYIHKIEWGTTFPLPDFMRKKIDS